MFAFVLGGSVQPKCGGWTGEARYSGENGIGNTDDQLATAARYVAQARRVVARQRARVIGSRALGRPKLDQELTLQAAISALSVLESGAQELANAAKRFECPQLRLS